MKHFSMILVFGMAVQVWAQSPDGTLDKMIADGKSPRELAVHLFDTHGCKSCHTTGKDGKLGFTKKGEERAQGFEGCISTLKAMTVKPIPDHPKFRSPCCQRVSRTCRDISRPTSRIIIHAWACCAW